MIERASLLPAMLPLVIDAAAMPRRYHASSTPDAMRRAAAAAVFDMPARLRRCNIGEKTLRAATRKSDYAGVRPTLPPIFCR